MSYEIDFLAVGDGKDSGDALAFRFTRPDTGEWVHGIVDAGFDDDGEALVDHVKSFYGTTTIDVAILTHPDADHIGGMGKVVRGLQVKRLWLHDIGSRGGADLPAAGAVNDLIAVAQGEGTEVGEVWAGYQDFGGALSILGPDRDYYGQLVQEQVTERIATTMAQKAVVAVTRGIWDRIADALGDEVPFPEKEVTPRNNSSIICALHLDGNTLLLTGDAGVPALDRAWNVAEQLGIAQAPSFVQIPHHGSRRNCSSAWLDRLLGGTGQQPCRTAFVSVVANSDKHPSGRVVNAYMRRGCKVVATADGGKRHHHDMPDRPGWYPVTPLAPMKEEDDN